MDLEDCTDAKKKLLTRSSARHRRRKRLKDARRSEPEQEVSGHLINEDYSEIHESNALVVSESANLTKSKARRLRKKEKKKQSEQNPSPVEIESVDTHACNSEQLTVAKEQSVIEKLIYDRKVDTAPVKLKNGSLSNTKVNLACSGDLSLDECARVEPNRLNEIIKIASTIKIDTASTAGNINCEQQQSGEAGGAASSSNIISRMSDTNEDASNDKTKSRENVKAEREARKAAKAAAKAKAKVKSGQGEVITDVSQRSNDPLITDRLLPSSKTEESVSATRVNTIRCDSPSAGATDELAKAHKNKLDKSKAELRAERRAKQEAQRAVKQQQRTTETKKKLEPVISSSENSKTDSRASCEIKTVNKKPASALKEHGHEANLFKHLYHEREMAFVVAPSLETKIHPGIVRLGVQYANKVIVGSNARCVALLTAIKQMLRDFERPPQADFIRSLEASLQESAAYLHHCRPLAVSMQNALRHLKWQMTQLSTTLSDMDAKAKLENAIDTYIQEQIQLAGKAISITIQTKILDGDVILTYGYSSLINKILLDAHAARKNFRVIVVDGRPWLEGREQLRRLAKHGIECSYILINALSFVMPEVSKVFLGAHAILANGAVMSRVGTAQVALMARTFNVPVLVACETHKSCERVQTDSIVYNELGNPDELAQAAGKLSAPFLGGTTNITVVTNSTAVTTATFDASHVGTCSNTTISSTTASTTGANSTFSDYSTGCLATMATIAGTAAASIASGVAVVRKPFLTNWKIRKTLNLLNITYDVTPADLVTAVVTELAILPCTSVPVILRIKPSEI